MTKKIYKNILFDLDGTLLNTLPDIAEALNVVLRNHGLPTHSEEKVMTFIGNGVKVLVAKAVEGGEDNPLYSTLLAEYTPYYAAHSMDLTHMYDGMQEVLDELKSRGIKMGIVTNKPQVACEDIGKHYFKDYMTSLIGDCEERKRKPDPEGTYLAFEQMGASAEDTLYVGDSPVDATLARNAGMDFILVKWGFTPTDVLEAIHDKLELIDTPSQILKYF